MWSHMMVKKTEIYLKYIAIKVSKPKHNHIVEHFSVKHACICFYRNKSISKVWHLIGWLSTRNNWISYLFLWVWMLLARLPWIVCTLWADHNPLHVCGLLRWSLPTSSWLKTQMECRRESRKCKRKVRADERSMIHFCLSTKCCFY